MQRPLKETCTRLGISKQQLKRKCVEHDSLIFGGDFWKINSEESVVIGNKTFSMAQLQPVVSGRLQGRLIGEIASEHQIAYMAQNLDSTSEHGTNWSIDFVAMCTAELLHGGY